MNLIRRNQGRKRLALGWAVLLTAVVLTGAWLLSRWYLFGFRIGQETGINVRNGMVSIGSGLPIYTEWSSYFMRHQTPDWQFWFTWEQTKQHHTALNADIYRLKVGPLYYFMSQPAGAMQWDLRIAFWPLPIVLFAAAWVALQSGYTLRRRARTGACLTCGYNRHDLLPEMKCPECGTKHETLHEKTPA